MDFRIKGLSPEPFRPLFGLSDVALAEHGVLRKRVDALPGYPDRVELRDAEVGQSVLLLNYEHQPAASPYRSRHAIYVREGVEEMFDRVNEVPPVIRPRTIALRAFDAAGMIRTAELVEGREIEPVIEQLLAMPEVDYLHAHYAKYGCYAARVERA